MKMVGIHSMGEVDRWIRYALICASIQIAMGALLIVLGLLDAAPEALETFAELWNLFDLGLLLLLATGLHFRSRTAAIGLLSYFVLSRISIMTMGGGFLGCGSVFLFVFYLKAAEACIAYHRLRKQADPDYRPSFVPALIGGAIGVILVPCMALAVISMMWPVPLDVVDGAELGADNVAKLRESKIVRSSESVELYYGTGVMDVTDGGSLLTNSRVIAFHRDDDGILNVRAVDHVDVLDAKLIRSDSVLSDDEIHVMPRKGDILVLSVPSDGSQSEDFLTEIEAWTRRND